MNRRSVLALLVALAIIAAGCANQVTLSKSGQYEFTYHAPGHYEAGMVLPITIQ